MEIAEADRDSLSAVVAHDGDNFGSIVAASGLSRTRDFIGADLSCVDFSGSDLRGFNFTGANLSNTTGVGFHIDETTILRDATVTSSVLAFEKERRDYFAMNQEHFALYNRLKNEYWTNGAIWIGQNLRRTSKNFELSSKIAKYLYASVKDQTYKNQILYGIKHTFATTDEYKAFLMDQLRDPEIKERTLRGIIDILGSTFSNDPDVVRLLLMYLGHDNKGIRRICVEPVMRKRFFKKNKQEILKHVITEQEAEIRRRYTALFARLIGKPALLLMYNQDQKSFHDYEEEIDNRKFEKMVTQAVRADKIERKSVNISKGESYAGSYVKYKDFVDNIEAYEVYFGSLKKHGLPLKTTYTVDDFYPKYDDEKERSGFAQPTEKSG